jgi:hypothetical protein
MQAGYDISLWWYGGGAGVLLLFAIMLRQRAMLRQVQRSLDAASRKLSRRNDSSTSFLEPLLEKAPFAMCYTDMHGKIIRCSEPFTKLAPVKTIAEFNASTNATLPIGHTKRLHQEMILRTSTEGNLRHFTLLTWPVPGEYEQLGAMYTLIEQTKSVHHAQLRDAFTTEVFALQQELVHHLAQHRPSDEPALRELQTITSLLVEHAEANERPSLDVFNLITPVGAVLEQFRPALRKKSVGLTVTLPKRALVYGNVQATLRTLNLMFSALEAHAEDTTVRLHLGSRHHAIVLDISFPQFHLPSGSLKDLFAFGSKTDRREAHARLALARLLMEQQHGSLTVTEDDEEGIVLHLAFATAPAHTRERA